MKAGRIIIRSHIIKIIIRRIIIKIATRVMLRALKQVLHRIVKVFKRIHVSAVVRKDIGPKIVDSRTSLRVNGQLPKEHNIHTVLLK